MARDFLGENAAFAAIPTPAPSPPQARLTEAAITCSPEDDAGHPVTGQGDRRACETLLAMPDVAPWIRTGAEHSLAALPAIPAPAR